MADDRPALTNDIPKEIDFLLFRAAGASMAVEAAQVEGIISREQAEQRAIKVGLLGRLLGADGAIVDAPSKVLLFRDGNETYGIGINALDTMVREKIGTLQPLPELLSHVEGLQPFWGVLPRENEVVLLIDLFRLKSLIGNQAEQFA